MKIFDTNIDINNCYDVLIITDRTYGLYTGYATHVLGLKTKVLYLIKKDKKTTISNHESNMTKVNIWHQETIDDYLFILDTFNITYDFVEEKKVRYLARNSHWFVIYNNESYMTKNLIFALSNTNSLMTAKTVSLRDFQIQPNLYLMGEKALYDGKVFASEVYVGEGNLVAQQIYKSMNNTSQNVTIHSTDFTLTT